ncbi:G-type lectin S-receptor-like serine/threonine-protein kinase RKS1 isoform X2 [Setaria viridis]|uniref:G-type lectin S-receptor-like serine/threonine-protein kinase RKS1 isoform X2 n=1 Tax=Setaria viridis TaxID=4556 RepID=UPI001493650F|nr:G-type lectin S-receptor-like serine/threonine-protein kinase RKS1 isoform X2 [Setaria viridis]
MVPGQKQDRAFFIIATVYSSAVLCTRLFFWLLSVWRKEKRRKINTIEEPENMDEVLRLWRTEDTSSEFSLYDFSQIADATDNFSPKSKLGEGGFGPVYKGVFPDGQELAIKRLSARSQQGLIEFKNEIQVITKLQHRNLVRLLGCCIHGEEKMLVYEYLTNKSLDHFIFDPIRRASLKWKMRIKIVEGYSRQMPLKQQQADLWAHCKGIKVVLLLMFLCVCFLTSHMPPCSSGYMAPEYASDGLLSIKSDVFSFGVLLLEIISGKRSSGFQYNGEFYNLLEYAWQLWKGRRWSEFIDKSFGDEYEMEELVKYLAVALICVQEKAMDRPTMRDVVALLSSDGITMPEPKQPAYSYAKLDESVNVTVLSSRNDVTITTINGR